MRDGGGIEGRPAEPEPSVVGPNSHAHAPGSGSPVSRPAESPESEVTGRGGGGGRGGQLSATAQPEPVRVRPTVWTDSGLEKGRPGPAERRTPFLWATRGLQPRNSEARPRAPHPAARDCAPSHTHTCPVADKGVLCFLRGREGICHSAATGHWRPRSRSAPWRRLAPGTARARRPGLQRSRRGKRPVWLIHCPVARGVRKSTSRFTSELVEMNRNEEGLA